jgi:HEPN domain-containing protein
MRPSDARSQLASDWLRRAERDLRFAHLGLADASLSGLVAFHGQQAAEKALKAYLAWNDRPPPRSHDLPLLLDRCRALDPAFAEMRDAAGALDDYLTAGRYPDTGPDPTPDEGRQAMRLAEQVVEFVRARLPSAEPPP